ncbi:lysophospholipid acyltransferase family protein [Candidatus Omnitrophota bacterium]
MLFYVLYKIGYFLSNIFPLKAAYWLAERFTDAQYFAVKKDRDAVIGNLSIVLKKDKKECRAIARKVFRSFGLYLVDFFRMHRIDKKDIGGKIKIEGRENLDEALKKGKGAIVLTCHIGNWEMGGVVAAMAGYDISAVVLNHMHKDINDFFIKQREEKGMKAIRMNSVMKRCVSVLMKNGVLALAGDRDFTGSGVKLDFFGVPTSIPKGPAALSLKIGTPIVPGFLVRVGRYNSKLIFDRPIEIEKKEGLKNDEAVKDVSRHFVRVMEKYIRAYPEQWLLFRNFWESPKGAFVI